MSESDSERMSEHLGTEEPQYPPLEPTGYVYCPVEGCGEIIASKGKYVHFRNKHPDLNYNEYKDKFTPAPAPEPVKVREEPLYKEETDPTEILREVLDRHPDIPKRVVEEVCSWAEFGPIHPTQLVSLLSSMRGISTTTAYIVAQKYALALQKAQSEGKIQLPPMIAGSIQTQQTYPPPIWFQPMQQQQLPPTPQQPTSPIQIQPPTAPQQPLQPSWVPPTYPTAPPVMYPQYDPRALVRDEMRNFEEKFARMIESIKPKEEKKEELVEIEEPVRDSEGKIVIGPDDKPIMKRLKVPASHYAPRQEDVELKFLEKMKLYKDLFGEKTITAPAGVTKDDIRATVKEVLEEKEGKLTPEQVVQIVETKLGELAAKQKPEESEELKTLRNELAESKKKLEELKETLTAQQRQALEDRIRSLESEIRRVESMRSVEGQWSAERIIGQGLNRVADVVERKEPLKVIIEKAPELVSIAGGVVPQQTAAPQHRMGLIELLRQRGLTVQQ